MQPNPIWIREMRARWRGWRAFALLAAYVTVLAGVLLWRYNDFLHGWQAQEVVDPRLRMALLGHELFLAMICLQAGLWMLIAPVLTATSITSERERGLMESLHLSHLSARQIVFGKLLSALSFIALLLVVTLPIEAICFLMGGVSPGEVLWALALHVGIALLCAAFGLAVSAWSFKSLTAMAVTMALSLPGSFVSFAGISGDFDSSYAELFTADGAIAWKVFTLWLAVILFSALPLLWTATRGARKVRRAPWRLEWSRLRRAVQIESTPPPRPKAARRWELGFLARLQFANPILGREVRACFRPRSSSPIMVGLAVLLLPFAVFAYGFGLYEMLIDANMRHDLCAALCMIYLVVAILLCAVQSAGAFAREREQSTLTALRLSLLSPRELIFGKMGAPLLVVAVCGLVFLPFFLLSVRSLKYSPESGEIALSQMLGAALVLAASSWCVTLIGLTFSWFNRRMIAAMCWTVGTLFAWWVAAPVLLLSTATYETSRGVEASCRLWHPAFAMFALFDQRSPSFYETAGGPPVVLRHAAPLSFLLFLVGTALLFALWRGVLAFRKGAD